MINELCVGQPNHVFLSNWFGAPLNTLSFFPAECGNQFTLLQDSLISDKGLLGFCPITIIKGLIPNDWLVALHMLHSTSGISLCHCSGYNLRTRASVFLTDWLSLSIKELPSGCNAVDQMGLQPNISRNFMVSSAVKHVP